MAWIRDYSIGADFPSGAVDLRRLQEEVDGSSIATVLEGVSKSGNTCTVQFEAEPSSAEKTTLDNDTTGPSGGLIGAHSGDPIRNLIMVAHDPVMEPVVPGASKVLWHDRPGIEIQDAVTGYAAIQEVWPLEEFSSAELFVTLKFVLKESGTGSNIRIAGKVKSHAVGEDSSDAFESIAFVVIVVTHTTIGEVFEGVVSLDASGCKLGDALALQFGRDGNNELGAGTDDDVDVPIVIISTKAEGR